MPNPFDVTLKHLVEGQPDAWLAYAGLPGRALGVLDADVSTLSAQADKVIRALAAGPYLTHLEFQARYEKEMGRRMLRYNVLLDFRHGLPVESVVLLLRPEADGPGMSGRVKRLGADGQPYLDFTYRVVRVWKKPVEDVMAGGLSTLPLAPLTNVKESELPDLVRRMDARLRAEAPPELQRDLWAGAFILMGLRYESAMIENLMKGVGQMKESTTYQAILREGAVEGRVEEAREIVLRLGGKRFGAPDKRTQERMAGIGSTERLEQLIERILEAETWMELLA